jgi:hypoxanthine phosphoribosyltransferase
MNSLYNAPSMTCSPESLAERIIESPGVYNPNGPHHEFKDRGHGFKVDMEQIPPGSELFDDLVDRSASMIHERFGGIPRLIISIANGGHPWADAIGESFGSETEVLHTEKDGYGQANLNFAARCALRHAKPQKLVIIDDLGTTGASIMPVYRSVNFASRLRHRIPEQSVFYVATRKPYLTYLKRNKVPYDAAVNLDIPTFSTEESCATEPAGLCRRGIELIRRPKG